MSPLPGAPRVLLDRNLEPMIRVGLARMLTNGGVEVLEASEPPVSVIEDAGKMVPDAVVVDLDAGAEGLERRLRAAVPSAKLILCARDETELAIFDPGIAVPRRIHASLADALVNEVASQSTTSDEGRG